ncbi:hypothetical protein D3C84_1208030 [compost metagenome]
MGTGKRALDGHLDEVVLLAAYLSSLRRSAAVHFQLGILGQGETGQDSIYTFLILIGIGMGHRIAGIPVLFQHQLLGILIMLPRQ